MRRVILSLALSTVLLVNCAPAPTQSPTATLVAATFTLHPIDTPAPTSTPEATATPEPFDFEANFEPAIKFPGVENFDNLSFIPSEVAESAEFDAYLDKLALEGKLGKFPNPKAVVPYIPEFSALGVTDTPWSVFVMKPAERESNIYMNINKRPEYVETFFRTKIGEEEYLGWSSMHRNIDGSENRIKYVFPREKLSNSDWRFILGLDGFNPRILITPTKFPRNHNYKWVSFFENNNYYDAYWLTHPEILTFLDEVGKDPQRKVSEGFTRFLWYPDNDLTTNY